MKKIALLFTTILLIAGCSNSTKKSLGLIETTPDEYKVKRNKPLDVPPCYQKNNNKIAKQHSGFSKAEQALLKEAK